MHVDLMELHLAAEGRARAEERHAFGVDGTPLRRNLDRAPHPGSAEGLAPAPEPRGHAEAIMDRVTHNTVWVETGSYNMSENTALATAQSMWEGVSDSQPHRRWRSLAGSVALNRTIGWLSKHPILSASNYTREPTAAPISLVRLSRPKNLKVEH